MKQKWAGISNLANRFMPTLMLGVILLITIPWLLGILVGDRRGWFIGIIISIWGILGSILFFPQIVLTAKLPTIRQNITLRCDGRKIAVISKDSQPIKDQSEPASSYQPPKEMVNETLPVAPVKSPNSGQECFQVVFQVWRQAVHKVCLIADDHFIDVIKANTYEHRLCQINYPPNEKSL